MIAIEDYYMGRDIVFKDDLSDEIRANAKTTVERANKLLARYIASTGDDRPRRVTSGWRPPSVNEKVSGAAKRSNHMVGRAIDIADASRALKRWLVTPAGQVALIECGLWMEHPDATPTWVHVQIVPPRSGSRVFRP